MRMTWSEACQWGARIVFVLGLLRVAGTVNSHSLEQGPRNTTFPYFSLHQFKWNSKYNSLWWKESQTLSLLELPTHRLHRLSSSTNHWRGPTDGETLGNKYRGLIILLAFGTWRLSWFGSWLYSWAPENSWQTRRPLSLRHTRKACLPSASHP